MKKGIRDWCCFRNPEVIEDRNQKEQEDVNVIFHNNNLKLFSIDELRSATENFNPACKIGRGGFGIVYKGTLSDGRVVAIKALSAESTQGMREFLTEIHVISGIKHPNLVELVGCCIQAENRILVYEYVENRSLDRTLFGLRSDPYVFSWNVRSAICKGIARGLVYLHEEVHPHIVHRDIKASNILLDLNYEPKIGDFGLAKLFPDNVTHISTRVAGTTGYLAPEYLRNGQLTKKADVYSFGVLVLEIISGKSSSKFFSSEGKTLLERTWELHQEGRLTELADRSMASDYSEKEVVRFIKVALFCTQAAAGRRPTMLQVLEMLNQQTRLSEKELMAPGYIDDGGLKVTPTLSSAITTRPHKSSFLNEGTGVFTSGPSTMSEVSPR